MSAAAHTAAIEAEPVGVSIFLKDAAKAKSLRARADEAITGEAAERRDVDTFRLVEDLAESIIAAAEEGVDAGRLVEDLYTAIGVTSRIAATASRQAVEDVAVREGLRDGTHEYRLANDVKLYLDELAHRAGGSRVRQAVTSGEIAEGKRLPQMADCILSHGSEAVDRALRSGLKYEIYVRVWTGLKVYGKLDYELNTPAGKAAAKRIAYDIAVNTSVREAIGDELFYELFMFHASRDFARVLDAGLDASSHGGWQ